MNEGKLLTVEEVEDGSCRGRKDLWDKYDRARITVKALCKRLARVEVCCECQGTKGFWKRATRGGILGREWCSCLACKDGHSGLAHENWQAVLRMLGEDTE